jgi:hypothetical protein
MTPCNILPTTELKAKGQLEADYDKMNFVFGKTTLFLNELPLDIRRELSNAIGQHLF